MTWTLARIKAKVRRLTGRPDEGQLSGEDLARAVNDYYVNVLGQEVSTREVLTWFELALNAQDPGEYGIDPAILSLAEPVTVKDALDRETSLVLHEGARRFFEIFPPGEGGFGRPRACLLYNRTLIVRPAPDADYVLRASGAKRPAPLEQDSDEPLDSKWGPVIAYGAAMEILHENGQGAEADALRGLYGRHLQSIAVKQIQQIPTHRRAEPAF